MISMNKKLQEAIDCFLNKNGYDRTCLKAVLFDMDGVLFDSMKNHTKAWYQTMQGRGIPAGRDEFYLYEGATGKATVNLIFERTYGRKATQEEIAQIYEEKSRLFNELPPVEPMPGIKEIFKEVKELDLIPVLVTGSGQGSLLQSLDQVYPGVFLPEHRVTAFDVHKGKPHPEPYLMGLEKAGIRPEEALVVENAPLGVEAGVAAGIFTVAVNTGPIPDQKLQEAGADLIFPDMPAFAASFGALVRLLGAGDSSRRGSCL